MRHLRVTTVIAALAAALAPAALSAEVGELAVEGQAGYRSLAFQNTASAIFDGSSEGGTFGGALRYTFWHGAFVSAGFRTFSKDGERVFVASATAPVQRLGFPLSLKIDSFPIVVGYRFRRGRSIVPYVAAGASIARYSETSTVAGESFAESFTKTGFVGAGGFEVGRGLFRLGAEAGYTTVTGAVGIGGVSQVYGEDDIGGFHVVGKLVVAFDAK